MSAHRHDHDQHDTHNTQITREVGAQTRALRIEGEGNDDAALVVVVKRHLPGTIEHIWAALTRAEQVSAWFQPLTGDLREGGEYTLEGLDSGTILTCNAPHLLRFTFGDADSIVTVQLAPGGNPATAATAATTDLQVEHRVPMAAAGSPAGALFIGTAWDANMLNLATWLTSGVRVDAFAPQHMARWHVLIDAWHDIIRDTGTMEDDALNEAAAGVHRVFNAPPSPPPASDMPA